jgi:hypothetical protein
MSALTNDKESTIAKCVCTSSVSADVALPLCVCRPCVFTAALR